MAFIKTTTYNVMDGIPDKDTLLLVSALFFAVYGWNPDKVSKMNLSSVNLWVKLAKKRMTWGGAMKLRALLEPKKKSLFQKVMLKIKYGRTQG